MTASLSEPPRGRPTKRAWWIIGVTALIAIVVVVILLAWRPSDRDTESGAPSASPSISPPGESSPTPTDIPASASPAPIPSDRPAEPIEGDAEVLPGLVGRITAIQAVEGTASRPGEVAGPAIQFDVEFENSTASPLSLATTIMNVEYGIERIPAAELSGQETRALPGEIPQGQSVSGTFVFTVPRDQRGLVRITVDYSVDVAPLVFEGAVPG